MFSYPNLISTGHRQIVTFNRAWLRSSVDYQFNKYSFRFRQSLKKENEALERVEALNYQRKLNDRQALRLAKVMERKNVKKEKDRL